MTGSPGSTRWFHVYLNASAPGARPAGLLRQVHDAEGAVVREEAVGRDGQWHRTEEFRRQWLGHNDKDLVEVPQEQAEQWLEDFRERLRQREVAQD